MQDNYNIVNKSINNAVNKSLKEYNAAGLKPTNSNINIRTRHLLKNGAQPVYQSIIKNQSFKKVIKNTGKFLFSKEDFISAVAGLAIDYFSLQQIMKNIKQKEMQLNLLIYIAGQIFQVLIGIKKKVILLSLFK